MLFKLFAVMPLMAQSTMAAAIQAATYKNMAYYGNWYRDIEFCVP